MISRSLFVGLAVTTVSFAAGATTVQPTAQIPTVAPAAPVVLTTVAPVDPTAAPVVLTTGAPVDPTAPVPTAPVVLPTVAPVAPAAPVAPVAPVVLTTAAPVATVAPVVFTTGAFTTGAPFATTSVQDAGCKMQIPPTCVFPFTFKGLAYTTCTGVDAVNTLWCSTDSAYTGHWARCHNPCKDKWPVKKIASTVVAGSVAATGIGLITAAIIKNQNAPLPLATTTSIIVISEPAPGVPGVDEVIESFVAPLAATTTPAPYTHVVEAAAASLTLPPFHLPSLTHEPATTAPGLSFATTTPGIDLSVGIDKLSSLTHEWHEMTRRLADAPARQMNALTNAFLGKSAADSTSIVPVEVEVPVGVLVKPTGQATLGTAEATRKMWVFTGLILLGVVFVGFVCSVAAAYAGGFGQKRKRRVNSQETAAGYPQAYTATAQ